MANNGHYISSDQVASSTPFDPTTGDGYIGTDVQSVLQELRNYTIYGNQTTTTTTNGTLILSSPIAGGQADGSTSGTVQFITGSATGFSVQMPNATTLSIGAHYKIDNTSSQPININDGSGALLFILGESSVGELTLQSNGTSAGVWVWYQLQLNVADGITSYNVTSSTSFAVSSSTNVLVTGMTVTPIAGTYAIWLNAQCTGGGSGELYTITIYNGATGVADSIRTVPSPAGGHQFILPTQTISQFNGTNTCAMYINTNGYSLTIYGRSLMLIRLGA